VTCHVFDQRRAVRDGRESGCGNRTGIPVYAPGNEPGAGGLACRPVSFQGQPAPSRRPVGLFTQWITMSKSWTRAPEPSELERHLFC
jgi:hypothetical protein